MKKSKRPLKIKIAGIKTHPYVISQTLQKLKISGLRSKPFVKQHETSKQETKETEGNLDQAMQGNRIKIHFVQSYFGETLPYDYLNIVRNLTIEEVFKFLRTDKKVYWMGDHFEVFDQADADYLNSC